jgi:hypothetical protein
MERDRYALHPVFRALAWVLGPLMILAGLSVPLFLVVTLRERGWEGIWEFVAYAVLMLLGIPFGRILIAAARSGVDPMVGVFRTMVPAARGPRDPAALTPGSRVFAWIAGPFMIVMGCVVPIEVVLSLRGQGWMAWGAGLYYIASMLIFLPLGILFIRAARKGRDPTALL